MLSPYPKLQTSTPLSTGGIFYLTEQLKSHTVVSNDHSDTASLSY